jgi:hypothetical protein
MGDNSELSLIKFSVINFFSLLLTSRPFQPISTSLIKVVEALISSEELPDEEIKKRVRWIYEYTHKKVMTALPIIELAVFKNLDKGLNREIDIGENSYTLTELYKYLDEISKELTEIVVKIARRYSLDLPIINQGTQQVVKIE